MVIFHGRASPTLSLDLLRKTTEVRVIDAGKNQADKYLKTKMVCEYTPSGDISFCPQGDRRNLLRRVAPNLYDRPISLG